MCVVPDDYRKDLSHYWSRLMWYRGELWRITTLVEAITGLNSEVQKREKIIYDKYLQHDLVSDYTKFQVYPKINLIFLIVGIAMTLVCLFTIGASVKFEFVFKTIVNNGTAQFVFIFCLASVLLLEALEAYIWKKVGI